MGYPCPPWRPTWVFIAILCFGLVSLFFQIAASIRHPQKALFGSTPKVLLVLGHDRPQLLNVTLSLLSLATGSQDWNVAYCQSQGLNESRETLALTAEVLSGFESGKFSTFKHRINPVPNLFRHEIFVLTGIYACVEWALLEFPEAAALSLLEDDIAVTPDSLEFLSLCQRQLLSEEQVSICSGHVLLKAGRESWDQPYWDWLRWRDAKSRLKLYENHGLYITAFLWSFSVSLWHRTLRGWYQSAHNHSLLPNFPALPRPYPWSHCDCWYHDRLMELLLPGRVLAPVQPRALHNGWSVGLHVDPAENASYDWSLARWTYLSAFDVKAEQFGVVHDP